MDIGNQKQLAFGWIWMPLWTRVALCTPRVQVQISGTNRPHFSTSVALSLR